MAKVVGGITVSHDPSYPAKVKREGPECEIAKLYGAVKGQLQAMRPDLLVVFANDHFNTFFYDNFPTFAIGVAERASGPIDSTDMPTFEVAMHEGFGEFIRRHLISDEFDLSLTQNFGFDHGFMVPLFFLNREAQIPVVPIWVNAFVSPLPSARRALSFGASVRAAIEKWPGDQRVVAMGTGSISLEIGGPKVNPGARRGIPSPDWVTHVGERFSSAQIDELVEEATEETMLAAGNVGGELLNFLATLGVIGKRRPTFLEVDPKEGHISAAWNLEGK